jgi:ATPase subunit of ABC transporter with duplicated ATPase domains
MLRSHQILVNQISFILPNGVSLFRELSLSFSKGKKVGIVGKNGSGKSTLLKLINGELIPSSGSIHVDGLIAYVPQEMDQSAVSMGASIGKFLGFEEKIKALHRIVQGSTDIKDYEVLNEEWDIEKRIRQQLGFFELEAIPYDRCLSLLSGGEQTRCILTKAFSAEADFILLDEPTNHLDSKSRERLYQAIQQSKSGLIIVSHDRTLLDLMDSIVEISSLGARSYGGNYTFYQQQKEIEKLAVAQTILEAKKSLKKVSRSVQVSKEKHEQRQAKGRALQRTGSQAKIILNAMKNRSAQTLSTLSKRHQHMTAIAKEKLASAEKNKESDDFIDVILPKTRVPEGKIILGLNKITFSYPEAAVPIIENFSLIVKGPRRLVLKGGNGVGKTTLIKLMMKALAPQSGEVYLGTKAISYLDQSLQQLNPTWSVLDNFMYLNPAVKEEQARLALASFLFKNVSALTLVKALSGGERLRAMLACVLMSDNPPQLLILDEPTNHLDLHSIKAIESALANYQGSLIVISHDDTFLKNINVLEVYDGPFRKDE